MTEEQIRQGRLKQQRLVGKKLQHPAEAVEWLVAMQAQEFAHAKWAIGLRTTNTTNVIVERDFNEGKILRTHVLRPTWHFVSPVDIRWLLKLSAPRVHQANAYFARKLGFDSKLLSRAMGVFVRNLSKNLRTREQLQTDLTGAGIKTDGLGLAYLVMHAELEGIICSGPRIGKQFSYTLLDKRVKGVKERQPDDPLAELTRRYFISRGPATIKDFTTWSGLTVKQAREGLAAAGDSLAKARIGGDDHWFAPDISTTKSRPFAFLMPDYDELGMGYKNRSALRNPAFPTSHKNLSPYTHWLVINGMITGTYTRKVKTKSVLIETKPFGKVPDGAKLIQDAVRRYQTFFKIPDIDT